MMGTGIYGAPTPYDGGGGRKRKRKKGGGGLLGVVVAVAGAAVVTAFALGSPLLLGFDPWDAADFVDAPGLAKIDAFMDGWRHKHGVSEITFSDAGRTITFTYENGTLTDVSGEGYDGGESDSKWKRDFDEARRLIKEWRLEK